MRGCIWSMKEMAAWALGIFGIRNKGHLEHGRTIME